MTKELTDRMRDAFAIYKDTLGKHLVDEAIIEIEQLRGRIAELEKEVRAKTAGLNAHIRVHDADHARITELEEQLTVVRTK